MPNIANIGILVAKILRFFYFFNMAAVHHLGFVSGIFGRIQFSEYLGGFYHSAKFGYDRCRSFYNMNISIFDAFGWKMPTHTLKIGVLGQFDPLNGLQYQPEPKKTCTSPRHLSYQG